MKSIMMLIACGLLWGSQYIFNAIALESIPALWIAALRSGIGALVLIVACYFLGLKREPGHWRLLIVIGLLEATLPFLLVAWGQQTTAAAHAAVITGMNPLLTILLAPLLLKDSEFSVKGVVCGLIGFGGLLYLFLPQLQTQSTSQFVGAAAIFIAALSFALSLILVRKLAHLHPVVVARDVIAISAVQLLPLAVLFSPLDVAQIKLEAVLASSYLGVFCGGVVYILFMQLIMSKGPAFASFSNYLVPTVGVLLSYLISDQVFDARLPVSLGIIMCAIFVYQYQGRRGSTKGSVSSALQSS
ncbi:DMT family transporter [Pseudoalteromonas sp. DL2-H2.2]|uniref:DMT family transporter n=1 Tax=Pseudoalteromonas sp. DL2-H2.2 TaxID=2908889 RepID=UPI001F33465D|nr:DMT family transporter [Pseudoalteromonas sp. DL2-H2.2]MCF2908786.1 DMT family transporter [Pseudoalteromonas sp. DL2-H2.2]